MTTLFIGRNGMIMHRKGKPFRAIKRRRRLTWVQSEREWRTSKPQQLGMRRFMLRMRCQKLRGAK